MDVHPEPQPPVTPPGPPNQIIVSEPPPTQASNQPPGPTPSLEPAPEKHNREGLKSIISTLAIIILAPIVAFCLTAFVFQSYEVDGASMETTLQHQDRLLVFKVPRTFARVTGHPYIPNRGDVVIFNKSEVFGEFDSQKKQLVKRVIGLPGDRVIVKDGEVTVINKEHPEGFNPDETLLYGTVISTTIGNIDVTVPEGYLFVLGDNRSNSLDSRSFGPIKADDVVGKLEVRIFPFNKLKIF